MVEYDSLYGLKPEDYQHPGEKIAMATLKSIPLLDVIMGKIFDAQIQVDMYAETVANCFRITEKTNPRVYGLYKLALARLGIEEEYPLFTKLDYSYNAHTTGVTKPYIILNSSVISDFSDTELLNLIGHELGHIKSGHMLYHNIAASLNSILGSFGQIAQATSVALQYALMEWSRNSEYTADRAGLIATGIVEDVGKEFLWLFDRSYRIPDLDVSVDKVLKQVSDFETDTTGIIGKLLCINYAAHSEHPWSILRLKQINDWYNSGEYEKVISKYAK